MWVVLDASLSCDFVQDHEMAERGAHFNFRQVADFRGMQNKRNCIVIQGERRDRRTVAEDAIVDRPAIRIEGSGIARRNASNVSIDLTDAGLEQFVWPVPRERRADRRRWISPRMAIRGRRGLDRRRQSVEGRVAWLGRATQAEAVRNSV